MLLSGSHRFEKLLPVDIVQKDVFAAVTPAHNIVNGSGKLDSWLARHAGENRP
jgi:hypothetical protein